MCIYICIYVCASVRVCLCARMYIYIYIYICTYIYTYICTCICIYTYIYIHMYMHLLSLFCAKCGSPTDSLTMIKQYRYSLGEAVVFSGVYHDSYTCDMTQSICVSWLISTTIHFAKLWCFWGECNDLFICGIPLFICVSRLKIPLIKAVVFLVCVHVSLVSWLIHVWHASCRKWQSVCVCVCVCVREY